MSHSPRYISKLQGRRLLVLGGSSGIGFSVAEAALEHGADVVISSSNESKLQKAVQRLQAGLDAATNSNGQAPSVSSVVCDLSNADLLEENLASVLECATVSGTRLLDHVVFTAGPALKLTSIPDVTVQAVQEANLVRVVAPMILARLLPRYIHQTAASSFTLTGGVSSQRPPPGWSIMVSSGAAVEGLARGLAVDLKPLRVNVVALGAVHTEIFSGIAADGLQAVLNKFKKESLTNTVGTPEEAAEAYLYCMKNSFATGTVVVTDGGKLLA